MLEQIRIDAINVDAMKKLEQLLMQLETQELTEDAMLAYAYASMLIVATMGYNPVSMAEKAVVGASKLLSYVEEALDKQAS